MGRPAEGSRHALRLCAQSGSAFEQGTLVARCRTLRTGRQSVPSRGRVRYSQETPWTARGRFR